LKERPQSKQQSRVKALDNLSLSKRREQNTIRPQTSKGQRNIAYNRDGGYRGDGDEREG
jgi:hypothetical protein